MRDIGSGTEARARAHQHHRTHVAVPVELFERRRERLHHLGVEGVVHLRAVEEHRCVAVLVDVTLYLFAHKLLTESRAGL
jgi:hypothetical protein